MPKKNSNSTKMSAEIRAVKWTEFFKNGANELLYKDFINDEIKKIPQNEKELNRFIRCQEKLQKQINSKEEKIEYFEILANIMGALYFLRKKENNLRNAISNSDYSMFSMSDSDEDFKAEEISSMKSESEPMAKEKEDELELPEFISNMSI